MQPQIFETENNKCILCYADFLVINLDLAQLDQCMETLQEGQPYKYKPSFWKPSTEAEIKANTTRTFVFNREFEARFRLKGGECFISQNGETVTVTQRGFREWLTANLEERGYRPFEKPMHQLFFAGESIAGIALILIMLLMWIYDSGPGPLYGLGLGIAVGGGLLIHGLKHVKSGDTEITYYKVNKTE